jgi:hypothetical protein
MGFEPTTFCMASRRSSQLSYSRAAAHFTAGLAGPAYRRVVIGIGQRALSGLY